MMCQRTAPSRLVLRRWDVKLMIFLSHCSENKPAARKMAEAFAAELLPFWLDEQQLHAGAELRASLRRAITESDVYVYLVSKSANASEWVQEELQFALALEHESRLNIVPVRIAGSEDPLPPPLAGRVYSSLDPTTGGASRLAHNLASTYESRRVPADCPISVIVRLEKHRLAHTLLQARQLLHTKQQISVLMLNEKYEALDGLYWSLAEVSFPVVAGSTEDIAAAADIVAFVHAQSRRTIKEIPFLCLEFIGTDSNIEYRAYYDAGHERSIRLLLHRLQWNVEYLDHLGHGKDLAGDFMARKHLPQPFDGHRCDFAVDGQALGALNVPSHGHPWPANIQNLPAWGLTSPFCDLLPEEVGVAVAEIVSLRFLAGTLPSARMPTPVSLTYGLS
jgi:hypothetical protein